MKIKRIKKLRVNSYNFKVKWDPKEKGSCFCFGDQTLDIGTLGHTEEVLFMILCHELFEISATDMGVRLRRPDCEGDYIFVYDHRQFDTMMNIFAGLLAQFIEG